MLITNLKKYHSWLPLIILHVVFAFIFISNLHWGRSFLGWDSINPEQNFLLNFQRSFFSSWQEYYGTGLVAGHGFAALLPHTLINFILSLILPSWSLRTIYSIIFLYLGSLGMYLLVRLILQRIKGMFPHIPLSSFVEWIALISGIFYVVNLATVQQFYTQTEAFTFHYAALPWLFFATILLLEQRTRKNIILFAVVNFFASTQGFVPPIFASYFVGLLIFLFMYVVGHQKKKRAIKQSFFILLLTLLINSYWILPFTYYQATSGNTFLNAYNNIMQTPDFIEKNRKYGDLQNVSLIKGFFWESKETSEKNIFQAWNQHHNNPVVPLIGYASFLIAVVGLLLSLWKIKSWILRGFAGVFLFFFTCLATNTPPFSYITQALQLLSPTFRQAFRTAFTKFSLGLGFSYSIFLAIGIFFLLQFFYSYIKRRQISFFILIGMFVALIYYGLPYFKGEAFYSKLFLTIPPSYKQAVEFFKDKSDGRIAELPQDCAEGWYTTNWGYYGSGFLWYGIKQPIMARTFDVWGDYNENYYWEITQALRSQNMEKVDAVLKKYDVKWLLVDPNVQHCINQQAFTHNENYVTYIGSSDKYKQVGTFQAEGILPIKVYERIDNNSQSFVSISPPLPNLEPHYQWNDDDKAFQEYGVYRTNIPGNPDVYYPFRTLFTKRVAEERNFGITNVSDSFIFSQQLPKNLQGYHFHLPPYSTVEQFIPVTISFDNDIKSPDKTLFDIVLTLHFSEITLDNTLLYSSDKNITIGKIRLNDLRAMKMNINGEEIPSLGTGNKINGIFYLSSENKIDLLNERGEIIFKWGDSENKEFAQLIQSDSTITLPRYDGGMLRVKVPKILDDKTLGVASFGNQIETNNPIPCDEQTSNFPNKYELGTEDGMTYFRLISQNSSQCVKYRFPDLETGKNYLIEIRTRKQGGNDPIFTVTNKRAVNYLRTYIHNNELFNTFYYMLPANFPHELGYEFVFENYSLNNDLAINDFGGLAVWSVPYDFLKSFKLESPTFDQGSITDLSDIKVEHPNETTYVVESAQLNVKNPTFILYQGFHEGWKAYELKAQSQKLNWIQTNFPFLFGREIKDHVLVNNWANGWVLNPNSTGSTKIVVIFWPQYLEYAGFALLIGTFIGIFLYTKLYPCKKN